MSITNTVEDLILNHVLTSSTAGFVTTTNVYAMLHTADPGETATASKLASCARFLVHFSAAASATADNDATASVVTSAAGTITHLSLWNTTEATGTAGTFGLWSGALTASKTVNAGDTITLASDALNVSVN